MLDNIWSICSFITYGCEFAMVIVIFKTIYNGMKEDYERNQHKRTK